MATVPRYDAAQATPEALPGVRQDSVVSPGLLAAGAQQQVQAGRAMQGAAEDLGGVARAMQERENADLIFRAETALKTAYLDFERTVRQRKGIDAWGVAKDTAEWWDKAASTHREGLRNPVQRELFSQQAAKLRLSSLDAVSAHEATERRTSLVESANASIVSSINMAASNPDTAEIVKSDIIKRVKVLAGANGWGPEMANAKEAEALTNLHTQVVQSLIIANPTAAKEYYEANKAEINGTSRDPIERTLKVAGTKATAQNAADAVMAMEMAEPEALAHIRSHYEGEDEVAAVLEVKTRFAERAQMRESAQRAAADEAWRIYAKTRKYGAIPAETLATMDGRDVLALRDRATNDAAGKPVRTNFETYYALRTMASQDPAAFARHDLRRYMSTISDSDLERLVELQQKARTGAKDITEIGTQLSVAHNGMGWGEGDREKKGKFDAAVLAAISAEQKRTGQALSFDERQKIIDRFLTKGDTNGAWMPWGDRQYYEVLGTDDAQDFAPTSEDRKEIIKRFNSQKGRDPSEDEIRKIFRDWKGF